MKRLHPLPLLLAALALLPAFPAPASGVGTAVRPDHAPRDFDRLNPAVSFSPSAITPVDGAERVVVINTASFAAEEGGEARVYIDGDTVSYVQFATKHRFVMSHDTLSYMGFENRATLFSVRGPAAAISFSLDEGEAVQEGWTGTVRSYGCDILKITKGLTRSAVSKGWTLVAGNDTVRGATRMVWDMDMAYVNADSVAYATPDSVATESLSDLKVDAGRLMSERMLTERVMWLADNARYPVLQQTSVYRLTAKPDGTGCDTVPLSRMCMYYPAQCQYADTGEEYRAPQNSGGQKNIGYTCAGDGGNAISIGDPEVKGGTISVSLSCTGGDTEALVTIYSDSGLPLSEPVSVALSALPGTFSMPVPPGCRGVILIRVDAGEDSFTRKAFI